MFALRSVPVLARGPFLTDGFALYPTSSWEGRRPPCPARARLRLVSLRLMAGGRLQATDAGDARLNWGFGGAPAPDLSITKLLISVSLHDVGIHGWTVQAELAAC